MLQSFADFFKFVLKEVIIPAGADKFVFLLAPLLSFILAFGAWAAIPLAPGWVISNINVGVLYLFAISSLGVYGIIMGGWASQFEVSLPGRFFARRPQMVSYEVSIGFIIVTVILLSGSMNLQTIVAEQDGGFWNWNVLGGGGRRPLASARSRRDDPDDGDVLHLGPGRDQSTALRSARSGKRARGRVSGGIFVHALPAVHDRRVCQHRADVRLDLDSLLRRMERALGRRRTWRMCPRPWPASTA